MITSKGDNMISQIDDTFSEILTMKAVRVLITARTKELAYECARTTTGFGVSIIMSPAECAIERAVDFSDTPDNRPGYIIQIHHYKLEKLEHQVLARLSQSVLTAPTANVYDWMPNSDVEGYFKMGRKIAYFGDGYEFKTRKFGRDVWIVPRMDIPFIIDENISYTTSFSGNFTIFADTLEHAYNAAIKAANAVRTIEGVVSMGTKGIIASASKAGSEKYRFLVASANLAIYPMLRGKYPKTRVPNGGNYAYELVISAINFELLKEGFASGIQTALKSEGVVFVTASNFGGRLGKKKIYLRELF